MLRTIIPIATVAALILAGVMLWSGYIGFALYLSTLTVVLAALWITISRKR